MKFVVRNDRWSYTYMAQKNEDDFWQEQKLDDVSFSWQSHTQTHKQPQIKC